MSGKLAVILPIYDGAATLERTLRSLPADRAQELEIVAVVQASQDGSREIVAEAARHLPIRIIETEAGSNWVRNTNIGLEAASADIVTMLHQDDIWLPGRKDVTDRLVADNPAASLWAHPALYIDDADRKLGRIGPPFGARPRLVPGEEAVRTLLVQNTIPLPGAVFRRDAALAEGGLREELWYTADWDLWLRLAAQGGVGWSAEPAVAFRLHRRSQTVRGSADARDFAGQLAAPIDRHAATNDLQERQLLRMARASAALNSLLAGRYHGQPAAAGPFLKQLLPLGPVGWARFMRRTQIAARLSPRARLFLLGRQNRD